MQDTGIGIPDEDMPHLFEKFYRVPRDRRAASRGTGLGLSICKEIVQGHGGRMEVKSALGEGSTFSVFLPRSRQDAAAGMPAAAAGYPPEASRCRARPADIQAQAKQEGLRTMCAGLLS